MLLFCTCLKSLICRRLSEPYHSPAVDEFDFDVPYPVAPISAPAAASKCKGELHVHYHIFMARAAKAYYRFRKAVRLGSSSIESTIQAVRAADEELASIIDTLPDHLQPEIDTTAQEHQSRQNDEIESWITWQRFDLTLVLLHLRLRVSRTLQGQWLSVSNQCDIGWARTISVSSALSIIWINSNWDQPASMRKQW
jgi:hypothetical protein